MADGSVGPGGQPATGGSSAGGSSAGGMPGNDAGADAGVCAAAVAGGPCDVENQTCGGPCPSACSFCNVLRCSGGTWSSLEVFPAPCFDCGSGVRCQVHQEYCSVQHSDVAGLPDEYQCHAVPNGCAEEVTCSCLSTTIAFDECTAADDGELLVEYYGG